MTGAEPRLWARCLRENIKRVNELRQAQADNRVLKQLYREASRRRHGVPLPAPLPAPTFKTHQQDTHHEKTMVQPAD